MHSVVRLVEFTTRGSKVCLMEQSKAKTIKKEHFNWRIIYKEPLKRQSEESCTTVSEYAI